ncbi:glycerol-3-phosphate dehydrogenase/oxidase [Propionibacteriaceae bacterium Y1923]|uniref:glycerol-3-phosphate dehydrogenase/oxidase n=1 Tax=Aestuariimicrobium sp. Y1814 TaxID=3418742 RepID=UPI003C1B23DD
MGATPEETRSERFAATSAGYDVVVVGGGVNGCGIAWDAALRGLRVLLVEKGDLGSGTSSWSSKMIHGGLKYLEKYDVGLVRESLREREWLLQAAPHLVKELRFVLPYYKTGAHSAAILSLGMVAYDVLSFDKSVHRFNIMTRKQILRREPGLNPNGLQGGAVYSDAQVNYAERMTLEIAQAAMGAGAEVLTHVRAVKLNREGGKVTSLVVRDEINGAEATVPTRFVVNAAGPWIDEVWQNNDELRLPRMNGGTKGTHMVVNPFPGAPKDAFYYDSDDGRPMMVIPWLGRYLIGSTDLRFEGDLDMAAATQDEYDYILHETNKVIPSANLTMDDIQYSFTGVRPLPYKDADSDVSDITRRHDIRTHDGIEGLYTLVGGKLTTFRQVGEDMGDILAKKFGIKRKSVTRSLALPGGGRSDLAALRRQVDGAGLAPRILDRLVDQYGTAAPDLIGFITSSEERRRVLDEAFGLTVGEVEWAITREQGFRLSDVIARRTMIGVENDLGVGVLDEVADICARVLGWDSERREAEIAAYRHYITRFTPWKETQA